MGFCGFIVHFLNLEKVERSVEYCAVTDDLEAEALGQDGKTYVLFINATDLESNEGIHCKFVDAIG